MEFSADKLVGGLKAKIDRLRFTPLAAVAPVSESATPRPGRRLLICRVNPSDRGVRSPLHPGARGPGPGPAPRAVERPVPVPALVAQLKALGPLSP